MDERERRHWRTVARGRPREISPPGPNQESVWDYPRPPRVESSSRLVRIRWDEVEIARSERARRVCETASPPVFYLPAADVEVRWLEASDRSTHREWKGRARYWNVRGPAGLVRDAAWSYPDPLPGFESLRDHFAFFPGRVEAWLDEERVKPQPGSYYGGWVTSEIAGPFKGEPGSERW